MEESAGDLVDGGAYGLTWVSELLGTAASLVPYGWHEAEVIGVTDGTCRAAICRAAYEGYPYVVDVDNLDIDAIGTLVEALL